MVISGTKSSWRSVTGGIPQGPIVGLVLCNIFTNDLADGADCMLRKFSDDTKMGAAADTLGGHASIQRDVNSLEKWSDGSLIKTKKENSSYTWGGITQS